MSFSKEWTDWHLTPRGWEQGSYQVDFAGTGSARDCVQTYRWREIQTSPYARMHREGEVSWEISDKELMKRLRTKFGDPPNSL